MAYDEEKREYRGPSPTKDRALIERRARMVAELEVRTGTVAEVAELNGVSRYAPYTWSSEIMGHDGGDVKEKAEGGVALRARSSTTCRTTSTSSGPCCARRGPSSGESSSSSTCIRRPWSS
jgi:transposase-like protein